MDDFTFPSSSAAAAADPLDSPPLWRRSSTAPRHELKAAEEFEEEDRFDSPSLQAFRFTKSAKEKSVCEVEDEKMDMLWEDLNEDGKINGRNLEISSPRREVQISCVRGLRLSKANNGRFISAGKKTTVLVFIKALKKVFLMHNSSQRGIKKKASYSN